MFEAYKLKEWCARTVPDAVAACRDMPDLGYFVSQLRLVQAATILRVDLPPPAPENRDWRLWVERAVEHRLPLPFPNVVLEIPLDRYHRDAAGEVGGDIEQVRHELDLADGLLIHMVVVGSLFDLAPVMLEETDGLEADDSWRHVWITRFWRQGPWTLCPYLSGRLWIDPDQGRLLTRLELYHQHKQGRALPPKLGQALLNIMGGALGWLMACDAETRLFTGTRRRMMKHHHPMRDEYRVAVVNPEKVIRYARQEPKGTHASPIPHDRRGHLRTYRSGKQVWIGPIEVRGGAKAREGKLVKDYAFESGGGDHHAG